MPYLSHAPYILGPTRVHSLASLPLAHLSTQVGIGSLVGKVALPLLIFRSIAKTDVGSVDLGVVGCVLLVKAASSVLATMLALVAHMSNALGMPPAGGGGDAKREGGTRPSKCTTAGIFTLFVTNSNDLAVGLPLFTALYPSSQQKGGDIVSYLYVDGSHMSGRYR